MPTSTDTSASFTNGNAPLADGETMTDNNPILAYHAMIDLPNTAQQNAAATTDIERGASICRRVFQQSWHCFADEFQAQMGGRMLTSAKS